MAIEIINTGSELMIGRVLNTHHQWLCAQLDELGYTVHRQVSVSDESSAIVDAVQESLGRSNAVILTGGLGPTSDDLTRGLIAKLFHRRTLVHEPTLERIRNYFQSRGREIPFKCEIQAQYPEGALVIANDFGTAPGLLIELEHNPFNSSGEKALLIMLPGPPRELRPMFRDRVIPLLKEKLPNHQKHASITLKTACVGESLIEMEIAPKLEDLVHQGLQIGYCARVGEVDLRLSAFGESAEEIVRIAEKLSRETLGDKIYTERDEKLCDIVVRLLRQRGQTVGTAESCTGGFISNQLTNVPGASEVFLGSCITYSNEAKIRFLGVDPQSLKLHGAVSEKVAAEMASGLRERLGVDYALSATGIAGPGGGSEDKPVGTVFVSLSSASGTQTHKLFYPYDRESFKLSVAQFALDWLRRTLNGI